MFEYSKFKYQKLFTCNFNTQSFNIRSLKLGIKDFWIKRKTLNLKLECELNQMLKFGILKVHNSLKSLNFENLFFQ